MIIEGIKKEWPTSTTKKYEEIQVIAITKDSRYVEYGKTYTAWANQNKDIFIIMGIPYFFDNSELISLEEHRQNQINKII